MAKKVKEENKLHGQFKCPACDHHGFKVLSELPSTDFAAMLADGTRFTRVVRHRVECSQCAQRSALMRYEFDPEAWQE